MESLNVTPKLRDLTKRNVLSIHFQYYPFQLATLKMLLGYRSRYEPPIHTFLVNKVGTEIAFLIIMWYSIGEVCK